ncbi:MAG: hypothetical protein DRO67_07385 [Candidatus Asgardarchaeum californiense]|nr:MAG: hypothetical protein DRO67_07385 [Candidatus Asgardarchaeum californiense]
MRRKIFLSIFNLTRAMKEFDERYEEHLRRIYKWNVFGLVLSWVIWAPFQYMAHPYFQLYAKELGATPVIIAVISFVSTITLGFSRLVGGYVADKYGRKKIVVYMTALVSSSYLIYAFSPDWTWLVIGAFLSSVALMYQPALWSLMSDSTPKEKRGKIFSLYNFLPSIISSFSPFLAIYLISRYTLVPAIRLAYLLTFFSGMTVVVIRAIFLKETLLREESLENKHLSFKEGYKKALSFIKEHLIYLLLIDVIISVAASMSFLTAYYSVYFLGIDEITWGYIYIVSGFLGILVTLPSGFFIDKIGRKPIIIVSAVSQLFGDFLLFITPYITTSPFISTLIAVSLTSIGFSIWFIVINAITTDLTPLEFRGRINSIIGLIINITASITTLAAGAIYSFLGPNIPYLVATITLIFSILLIVLKMPETK